LKGRARDEPVRLTRVYTRGGDQGETSLGDGSRVSKLDCRIGAFGTVDELNSAVGVVLAGEVPAAMAGPLQLIQNELFDVGADLSVPWGVTDRLRVEQSMIDRLEQLCDAFNADLPELRSFVLPGGSETSARLHVARTICRRAEREVLLGAQEVEVNPLVLAYLNRLSDLLFILARAANAAAGREEPLWRPGSSR
jgi:cob(I)alamin adenosyltransferase